jgi:hypothetical protein
LALHLQHIGDVLRKDHFIEPKDFYFRFNTRLSECLDDRGRFLSTARVATVVRMYLKRPPSANVGFGGLYDRAPRRAQLSIRRDRRNYDRSMAGLGTSKAQRYFAFDFDRPSLVRPFRDRSRQSRSRQRANRGTARGQPVQQCSTGSRKDRRGRDT